MNMQSKLTAGVLAMICAGAALAQSHSVINMANPPNATSQSKAAVDATPSQSATADKNEAKVKDTNAGMAGKSKVTKPKKKTTAKGAKTSAGTSAESSMETQPSDKASSPAERAAFDSSPAHSGK